MTVRVSRSVLEGVLAQAAGQDGEVCGILLGGPAAIDAMVPAANVAPDPARHFEIDPAALFAAHRAARAGGPAIAGYYHSHPSGDAAPSAVDAASAAPDGMLWLIVAGDDARLWRAGAGEAGGTVFHAVRFVPV